MIHNRYTGDEPRRRRSILIDDAISKPFNVGDRRRDGLVSHRMPPLSSSAPTTSDSSANRRLLCRLTQPRRQQQYVMGGVPHYLTRPCTTWPLLSCCSSSSLSAKLRPREGALDRTYCHFARVSDAINVYLASTLSPRESLRLRHEESRFPHKIHMQPLGENSLWH